MCIIICLGPYGIEVILYILRAEGNAEVRDYIRLISQFICVGVLVNDSMGILVL